MKKIIHYFTVVLRVLLSNFEFIISSSFLLDYRRSPQQKYERCCRHVTPKVG